MSVSDTETTANLANSALAIHEIPTFVRWLEARGDPRKDIIHRAIEEFRQDHGKGGRGR